MSKATTEPIVNFPLDINSDRTNTELSSLQSKVSLLSDYRTDYQSSKWRFGKERSKWL